MDLKFDIFKIEHENLLPGQGRILISDPFLNDAYFKRSIVFITEYNEKGSVGFVLNKPVEVSINEILADFPTVESVISVGGPVGTNSVYYIHRMGNIIPGSVEVLDDIWWGGDFDIVKDLINKGVLKDEDIRFFVGYSGWEPGQLENEIAENSWVVAEFDTSVIMESRTRDAWKNVLTLLGDKYRLWKNFPENPGLN